MKTERFYSSFFFTILFTCILIMAGCTVNDEETGWTQWRGPNRNGISKERNLLKSWPEEGPALAWSTEGLGDGFSSAAIKDQMVYTTGKKDSVEVMTAMDFSGNIIWQTIFGRASNAQDWPQSRSTPTVYKNEVYAITLLGDVACLNRKNGEILWELSAKEKFEGEGSDWNTESPLVFDDKIIFTTGGKKTTMVALNRLTGETIWQSESIKDSTAFTSPVLFNKNGKDVIFTSLFRNDIFVDCETGEIIQKFDHISGMIPQVIEDCVFFTGEYKKNGTMCGFNDELTERTIQWKDTANSYLLGGAVNLNGKIVVAGFEKGIFCIDIKSGEVLSYYKDMNKCNLIVADDKIYCFEDGRGRLCLFNLNENKLEMVSSFKIKMGTGPMIAHLSISDGLLFVRRGEVLMAYDIKNKEDQKI